MPHCNSWVFLLFILFVGTNFWAQSYLWFEKLLRTNADVMVLWFAGFCVVLTTTVCARRLEPPQLQIDENEEPLATPLVIDEDEADTKESPEIDEDFSDFPKGLCQESIVRETCELLSSSRRHVTLSELSLFFAWLPSCFHRLGYGIWKLRICQSYGETGRWNCL